MKPTNIKFHTEFYTHKIEIIVNGISVIEAVPFINAHTVTPDQLSDITDQLVDGDTQGNFGADTCIYIEELDPNKETLVYAVGTWRIIPNYRDLHRIMMWNYNRAANQFEYYTKEDFIKTFPYNGVHYFEKYTKTFNHDLWKFIGYLGSHISEGESFLTLTLNKVEAYEKRQADNGFPVSY